MRVLHVEAIEILFLLADRAALLGIVGNQFQSSSCVRWPLSADTDQPFARHALSNRPSDLEPPNFETHRTTFKCSLQIFC